MLQQQDKETGVEEVEQKWQSRHVDEREIPLEQRKAEARVM